jgi:hypothetical protein
MANDDHRALVVGIEEYERFQPLSGPVNDAEHFYGWLTSPTGGDVPPANVVKVVSAGHAGEPYRDQVEDRIADFVAEFDANQGRIGRRLYIFLAGHGIDVGQLEDCGLVMANADVRTSDRCIPGRRVATAFKQSNAFDEVVLFMDCCREVTIQNPTGDLPILAGLPRDPQSPASLLHGLATQWTRTAGERLLPNPESPGASVQGIFTYALLDGLRRAGDTNGNVTGERLKGYVREYMSRLAGPGQDPDIDFAPNDIVICAPGEGSTRVHVRLPAGHVDFDVRDGDLLFQRVPVAAAEADGTWTFPLRPGRYLFGTPAGREAGGYSAMRDATVVGEEFTVAF